MQSFDPKTRLAQARRQEKTMKITILKWQLIIQVREVGALTRKEDFVVTGLDEADKQNYIAYVEETGALDDLKAKAAAMRAKRALCAA
jgi:hypothetical protein